MSWRMGQIIGIVMLAVAVIVPIVAMVVDLVLEVGIREVVIVGGVFFGLVAWVCIGMWLVSKRG